MRFTVLSTQLEKTKTQVALVETVQLSPLSPTMQGQETLESVL